MQNGVCSQVRRGFASHRAISSRVHVWETTTVHWCAETKASPVANAVDSVTAASALSFADDDNGKNLLRAAFAAASLNLVVAR
ncbi:hypothetical protein DITRI_Ditri15bG0033100 [Diplodiscus trichospermus]